MSTIFTAFTPSDDGEGDKTHNTENAEASESKDTASTQSKNFTNVELTALLLEYKQKSYFTEKPSVLSAECVQSLQKKANKAGNERSEWFNSLKKKALRFLAAKPRAWRYDFLMCAL